MGEMSAMGQLHRKDSVTDIEDREVNRQVGRYPAVGLKIGMVRAKKTFGPFNSEAFQGETAGLCCKQWDRRWDIDTLPCNSLRQPRSSPKPSIQYPALPLNCPGL